MARKVEDSAEIDKAPALPAAVSILDWDEGGPSPQGWYAIEITYRRDQALEHRHPSTAPLRAVIGDPPMYPKD